MQTTTSTSLTIPTTTTTMPSGKFVVHEWGVLSGGSLDTSYLLESAPIGAIPTTTMPDDHPLVKEPVIYVYSDSKQPFDVQVSFKSGGPTESYPEAAKEADGFTWSGVQFAEGGSETYPSDILKTINNVDSDLLEYEDQNTRSLFYEGSVSFQNQIRMIYNADRKEALIENKGSYPVYDLMLIVPKNGNTLLGKNVYADVIPKLGAGETVTVPLKQVAPKVDYVESLVSQGFTRKEAGSLCKYLAGRIPQGRQRTGRPCLPTVARGI